MENNTEKVYIPDFYAGRSIFITGGTGFFGKVLIEKLLRSCPDIAEIFVLIRPKKGLSANERLKKMLDNKLFDVLRCKQPSNFDKIKPITGDVAVENLGLLPSDRDILINNVNIIFHVAASVRFDESLKDAIFNNTRSTRDVCILAEKMKQLIVLLHVSSTYCQTDKPVVEETLYPLTFDWRKTIKVVESIDEHGLRVLTAKYLGSGAPNTYTFSKRLAESVINDYSESVPCIIIRPSIVISTSHDPFPGWTDNFNGPMGMLVGGGKGVLRVLRSDPQVNCDFIPVDLAIKAMIIVVWKYGITKKTDKTIDVYNCSSNNFKSFDMENLVRIGLGLTREVPLDNVIYKPKTRITKSNVAYYWLMILLHIVPALFLDIIIKLFGAQPIMLRLQRRIYVSNNAVSYFLLNDWKFTNKRVITMLDDLSAENEKDFGYPYKTMDLVEYFRNGIVGTKIHLLNENMNKLENAKRHYMRMERLDIVIKTLFVMIFIYFFYYNTFSYITDIFLSPID